MALGKPTVQKTTLDTSTSDLAVDGTYSCAQSTSSERNWLVIDLEESTHICGIGILTPVHGGRHVLCYYKIVEKHNNQLINCKQPMLAV